jgi:tetratricopeptide (TPR) repeat protein
MTRPQRNLLLILSPPAVLWLVLRSMPWAIGRWIGVAFLAVALVLTFFARDFLIGRYRMRKRNWERAIESFQRFERRLESPTWATLLLPFYLSLYSFDGIAVARNNIAIALMNLRRLEEAEGWLRSALRRDPLYALAYVNLGTIAALRNDEPGARRELKRAVDLGFSAAGAQLLMRKALAEANQAMGKPLE